MTPSTRLSQATTPNCPEGTTNTHPDLPLGDPKAFDGSNIPCANFLLQLKLSYMASPDRFSSDRAKSLYLLRHLTGPAWDWAAPLVERESPILENYALLTETLSGVFGHPDKAQNAMNRLTSLRQGEDSVATYAGKYQTIAASLAWDQTSLMHIFRLGLNEDIRKGLATTPYPETLQEMIVNAARYEQFLLESAQREPHTANTSRPSNHTSPVAFAPNIETSLKGIDTSKLAMGDIIKSLSPRDQKRITRNILGLCRFCGAEDHKVEGCPKLKNRPPLKGKAQSQ